MHTPGLSSSALRVIGAGVHSQLKSQFLSRALSNAGLLTPETRQGFQMLSRVAEQTTEAGVHRLRHDLTTHLIDTLG